MDFIVFNRSVRPNVHLCAGFSDAGIKMPSIRLGGRRSKTCTIADIEHRVQLSKPHWVLRALERFPFRRTISRICEVCSAFRSRDLIKTRGDRLAEAPDGERGILQSICGNFAQERLEFGE